MTKFKMVRFDDWEALYHDDEKGEKITEGHRIDARDLAEATGLDLEIQWATGPFIETVEASGVVPDKLSDYPEGALED